MMSRSLTQEERTREVEITMELAERLVPLNRLREMYFDTASQSYRTILRLMYESKRRRLVKDARKWGRLKLAQQLENPNCTLR